MCYSVIMTNQTVILDCCTSSSVCTLCHLNLKLLKGDSLIQESSSSLYVLRSSGISRKSGALIVTYSQKKKCIRFVFYCFENLLIAVTLEPLFCRRVGFTAKCTSPNEDLNNQIENWKCHMCDFQLIPLRSHHICTIHLFAICFFPLSLVSAVHHAK